MVKIAFINDTNNNITFFAEFKSDNNKFNLQNCTINIIHVYRGDADRWIRWLIPDNLEIYYLDWIEDIVPHNRRKTFKFLFEREEL